MPDKKSRAGYLKIGEMAERAGVLPSTIRYYTDMGLLKVALITEGGHRFYDPESTLDRLFKIKRLLNHGLSLTDLQAQLEKRLSKKKILVVDDDESVVDFIRDLLQNRFDHELQVAGDGFNAGRMVHDFEPDLVILDLMLPGINGFDVCQQIRKDPILSKTKVLVITGYDTQEVREKVKASGADDYLPKPLELDPTLQKIYSLLGVAIADRYIIRE
jgi:CheY-like chemotaxis protein